MNRRYTFIFALLASTVLSTNAISLTLNPTLDSLKTEDNQLPNSVFSYDKGSETDYDFTVQEADENGTLTTKYYKINIADNRLSTSSNISWIGLESKPDDMTNVIEIKLPNNQVKYFKYTYTVPSRYETITERNDNTLASSDVTDVVFSGIGSTSGGGAIYNTQNNSSVNIKSDFIGNYASSTSSVYGGAIYNYADKTSLTATIGNITGDFIGNYANGRGGAISNHALYNRNGSFSSAKATIGDITGDFIGNYANGGGGAIYNYAAHNRTGDYSTAKATIGNITGDFIGNYSNSSSSSAHGGAIFNYAYNSDTTATIGNITGDFIGNYSNSSSSSAIGGAISNYAYDSDTTATIGAK